MIKGLDDSSYTRIHSPVAYTFEGTKIYVDSMLMKECSLFNLEVHMQDHISIY